MIIPPEIQPAVAQLVEDKRRLERRVEQQNKRIAELQARVRQQQQSQRDKRDDEQRRARQAWQDAARVFG
jgi:Tfp pilus assembly protein PilE